MNVLPLILLLLLLLSTLSLKQVENFKNNEIVRKEYEAFIREQDYQGFNLRQRILYDDRKESYKTRQLNFRPFFHKKYRKNDPDSLARLEQLKIVFRELIKVLYGEAEFYKKLEKKRPEFINEILDAFIQQSDALAVTSDKSLIKGGIENLSQMRFSDSELQEAFYHMLKGTIRRKGRDEMAMYQSLGSHYREKSYLSLLDFLTDSCLDGCGDKPEMIPIYRAPRELLLAIYGKKETVEQIIAKRKELWTKDKSLIPERAKLFAEFLDNLPKNPDITNQILELSMSTTDPEPYN